MLLHVLYCYQMPKSESTLQFSDAETLFINLLQHSNACISEIYLYLVTVVFCDVRVLLLLFVVCFSFIFPFSINKNRNKNLL